jgi:uncharacterized protein
MSEGRRLVGAAPRTALLTGLALVYGAFSQRWLTSRLSVPAGLAASAGTLALTRRWGASWQDVGLSPADAPRGVRVGLAAAAPIAGVLIAGAIHPRTRRLFADERVVDATRGEAAYHMVLRIPIGTAVTEEVLFRAALVPVASAWLGPRRAVWYSSFVFGLWHVPPALEAHRSNPEGAAAADRLGGRVATVVATVAATTAAGIALCELRRRSRSLLAPIIAHMTLNAVAFGIARVAVGRARRPHAG